MNQGRRINKKQIALVHVAKAQLGLDEATYREMLAGFGVESSRDLTPRAFEELLHHLETCGFRRLEPGSEKARYLVAIRRLLTAKNLPPAYADKIGENMFGVARVNWLKPEQLHKVMVALIYHKQRQAKKPALEGETK